MLRLVNSALEMAVACSDCRQGKHLSVQLQSNFGSAQSFDAGFDLFPAHILSARG